MLPALVPAAQLEHANGRLWSVELLANSLIGPALGAFLIALWLPLPFALNAAAYAVAMVLVLRVTGNFRAAQTASRDWRRELGEGFAFLRAQPLLRTLAWTTGVWNLLHQMTFVALVLHAQENLGLNAQGLWIGSGGCGGGRCFGQSGRTEDCQSAWAGPHDAGDAGDVSPGICGDGAGAGAMDAGHCVCGV